MSGSNAIKSIGEYLLQEVIGRGNYGLVYKALNTITNEIVAIKMIPNSKLSFQPALVGMLEKELEALKLVGTSDKIIHLIKTFNSVNNRYIVYEYCNEGNLEEKIRKLGKIPEEEAIKYLKDLISVLQDLTKYDITHRDIKTDNILFKNGQLKLADFGFCKIGLQERDVAIVGSPVYMAPESLTQKIYNHKTEIYSLGVLFYEMLTGKYLFNVNTLSELISEKENFNIENYSEELEKFTETNKLLIARMLEPKPSKRITLIEIIDKLDMVSRPSFDKKNNKNNQALNVNPSEGSGSKPVLSKLDFLKSAKSSEDNHAIHLFECKTPKVSYSSGTYQSFIHHGHSHTLHDFSSLSPLMQGRHQNHPASFALALHPVQPTVMIDPENLQKEAQEFLIAAYPLIENWRFLYIKYEKLYPLVNSVLQDNYNELLRYETVKIGNKVLMERMKKMQLEIILLQENLRAKLGATINIRDALNKLKQYLSTENLGNNDLEIINEFLLFFIKAKKLSFTGIENGELKMNLKNKINYLCTLISTSIE